jgi:hypothetical protein
LAGAAPARPQALVLVVCEGGWDVHLFGDPRGELSDPAARARLVRYPPSEVRRIGNVDVGPLLAPLASRFIDDLTVVRGVHMGIDGHEFAMHHTFYGEQLFQLYPVDRDSIQAAWVRGQSDVLLPNVSLARVGLSTTRLGPDMGRTAPVFATPESFETLFNRDDRLSLRPEARDLIEAQVLERTRGARKEAFRRANAIARRDLGDLLSVGRGLAALGDRPAEALGAFDRQCLTAYQLVSQGLSSCVTIGLGGFDTHLSFQYDEHLRRGRDIFGDPGQFGGLSGLTMLIQLLKRPTDPDGRAPFDRTTIAVVSEFSRAELQRNHNPESNHYLLMGRGFGGHAGGRVFGASDEISATALRIDLSTGQPRADGVLLTPGHLYDTILAAGGVAAPKAIHSLVA